MADSLDIPALLQRYGLRPNKRLGQNFLTDQGALQRILEVADLQPEDVALEVGPGLGSLTRLLAENARRVVAVELDAQLLPALSELLREYRNVTLVQGDILAVDFLSLLREGEEQDPPYLVVANIPYYITSALIRHFLEARLPPRRLVLTVQREVAERICARPGEMNLLALSVQVYGAPMVKAQIPAEAFFPVPAVDSAVVVVERYSAPLVEKDALAAFFRLAKAGFGQKRKTLRNALAAGMGWRPEAAQSFLESQDIAPRRRAETLSVAEWRRLAQALKELPPQK
jgi:16S rRNA (adenine1518-N6/adenine1519-N6)-dimethyltransferase